jgi:hypothetical protein
MNYRRLAGVSDSLHPSIAFKKNKLNDNAIYKPVLKFANGLTQSNSYTKASHLNNKYFSPDQKKKPLFFLSMIGFSPVFLKKPVKPEDCLSPINE